jgi:hypothetical protein
VLMLARSGDALGVGPGRFIAPGNQEARARP